MFKIIILMLFFTLSFVSVGTLHAVESSISDEEIMDDALMQIKSDLITELKGKHPKLAKGLGSIDAKEFGVFLGSMAGGDYDTAFNLVGTKASTYFVDYFTERYSDFIPEGSPAAEALSYFPLTTSDFKAVYHQVWLGDYTQAGTVLKNRLTKTGTIKLKDLSKEIVTRGMDWVLSGVTGGSPGKIFVQLVEYEVEFLEFADKAVKKYFSGEIYEYYNDLREAGSSPKDAYYRTFDLQNGKYPLAEINSPGVKEIKDVAAHAEHEYLHKYGYKYRSKLNQQIQSAANATFKPVKSIMQKQNKIMFQYFMRVAAKYAEKNEQVKKLVGIFSAITKEKTSLSEAAKRYEKSATLLLQWYNDIDTKLTSIEGKEEKLIALQKKSLKMSDSCLKLATYYKNFEKEKEKITTYLKKIRSRGKKCQAKAKEICDSADNTKKTKKGITYIQKSISEAKKYKTEIDHHVTNALTYAMKVRAIHKQSDAIKKSFKSIDTKVYESQKRVRYIKKFKKLLEKDYFSKVDAPYQKIMKLLQRPLMLKYAKKPAELLLEQVRDLKKLAYDAYILVERLSASKASDLDTLEQSAKKLKELIDEINMNLSQCNKEEKITFVQMQKAIQTEIDRYSKYEKALEALLEKIYSCTDSDESEGDTALLAKIRQLFQELKSINGKLLSENKIIDSSLTSLHTLSSKLVHINTTLDEAPNDINTLVERCIKDKAKIEANAEAMALAVAASKSDMTKLKKYYVLSADASTKACGYLDQISDSTTSESCKQLASQSKSAAARAKSNANKTFVVAIALKGRYQKMISSKTDAQLDATIKKLLSKSSKIHSTISSARRSLDLSGFDTMSNIAMDAKNAFSKLQIHKKTATSTLAQLYSLIQKAGFNKKAFMSANEQLVAVENEIRKTLNVAQQRMGKVSTLLNEIEHMKGVIDNKIKELIKATEAVDNCRTSDIGTDFNDLRTYNDMAEVFGPKATSKAEQASVCAQKINSACENLQNSSENEESYNDLPQDDYDSSVWGERENQRQQEIDNRHAQNNYHEGEHNPYGDENDKDYGVDTLSQERADRLAELEEFSNSRTHHSSTHRSSSREDNPSVSTSMSSKPPIKPSRATNIKDTKTPQIAKLYYVVTEASRYLQRTATCHSTSYSVIGPLSFKDAKKFVAKRQKEVLRKVGLKSFPLYTGIKVSIGNGVKVKPKTPKATSKCTPCPSGEHIGLDRNKRKCHKESSSVNFSGLKNFGNASKLGSW